MNLLKKFKSFFDKRYKPTDGFWYSKKTGNTNSGIYTDEESALKFSVVFACVKVISETIAMLPLHIYERKTNGKERAVNHPLYSLLHDAPHSELTSFQFREIMGVHLCTWGNFYAYKENSGKELLSLTPLLPSKMTVNKFNGQLLYEYRDGTERKYFTREQILHIAGLGFDGVKGYSVIEMAKEAIGLGIAMETFGAKFFGQGTHPSVIAEHPGRLSPDGYGRLKKELSKNSRIENSQGIMILEEGLKLNSIGIPPEDAQFLETRAFQIADIARFYRMPLHKIQEMTHATFTNIEHQGIEFVTDTIMPWLIRIEQALQQQLLSKADNEFFFIEHLVDGLQRGDIQSRYQAYSIGRQNGWLSANDIRGMENMNPLDDGGDIYLVPLNMVNAKDLENVNKQKHVELQDRSLPSARVEKKRDIIEKAYYPLFQDTSGRIVRREVLAVKGALKKYGDQNITDLKKWIDKFYNELPDYICKDMSPLLASYAESIQAAAAAQINSRIGTSRESIDFTKKYVDAYSKKHVIRSKKQLDKLITESPKTELIKNIEERLNEWDINRSDKIAKEESRRANCAFARASWTFAGIKQFRWESDNGCDYCRGLSGKIVGKDSSFLEKGDYSPQGVDDPMTITGRKCHPPLHDGCRCDIEPVI